MCGQKKALSSQILDWPDILSTLLCFWCNSDLHVFKYTIGQDWILLMILKEKSWGRERKRRPDQERLLRKPFITRVGRGKEIGIVLISRTFVLKQDGNFANFGGGGKLWVLACATITTTETPTTCKCWLLKPLIFCSKLRLALRSHIRSHRYIYFFRDHHLLF